jgi:hypothetical protein
MSPIFQFQAMLVAVVNAISGSILSTERTVAYVLMTICLVLGVYEAYARGGDIRALEGTFLKYVLAAFLIGYWTNFFSDTFTGFNQLATSIDNSFGAGDLAANWKSQLQLLFQNNGYNKIFAAIPWTPSALLTLFEIALAYIIYPIATQIFALIYTFWGSCLFAIGPFVIALAPSSLINSLTKYYVLNLAIWNTWTVIYAVFGTLITAIHANDVNEIVNGNLNSYGFGTAAFAGMDGGIEMIGLVSIIYAICILLIPMVAAFILGGQFSAVGAGISTAVSRIVNGGMTGAKAGAAGGPVGMGAGAMLGAGLGLMGAGANSLFAAGNAMGGGEGGVTMQGGSGSMPPPDTPADSTRQWV